MCTSLPISEAAVIEGLSLIVEELIQHENAESRAIGKTLEKLGQSIGLLEDRKCKVPKEKEEGLILSPVEYVNVNNNMAAGKLGSTEVPGHNKCNNGQPWGYFSWYVCMYAAVAVVSGLEVMRYTRIG